jgi:hypothetical protein
LRGPRALVPEGYFFLAGSGEDESVQIIARTCTDVPNNAFIVIPTILNIWCSESHFDFCQTNVNPVAEVFTVDGKAFEKTTAAKEDDLKEVGDFSCDNSLTDGLQGFNIWYFGEWLIIPPLSVDEHVISVKGSLPDFGTTEVTHTITVVRND